MPRLKLSSNTRYRSFLSGWLVCMLGLGSPSCGSWGGNPPKSRVEITTTAAVEKNGTVEIILQGQGATLKAGNHTWAVTDKAGRSAGQITLSSAQLVLSNITVRRDRTDIAASPKLSGPFSLDLLSNTRTPSLEKLSLGVGDYKNVRLQLYKHAGGSLQLTGTYTAPNQKSSVIKIVLDADDEISLTKETQAIQVISGVNAQIAVTFQLDQWFNFKGKDTDLSNYAGQDISIDSSAAGDQRKIRDALLANVKAAVDFDKYQGPGDNKGSQDKDDKEDDNDGRRDKDD